MRDTKRVYGGVAQEERVAARREKLMQAALTLIARHGPSGAAVTAICAEAGLTARYFYESFASREALLMAVFERVTGYLFEDLEAAAKAADPTEAVLREFFEKLREHPALTQMFLIDFDSLDAEMHLMGRATADRIVALIAPGIASPLASAGLVGAIMRSARAWIGSGAKEPVDEVVALARRFVTAALG